MTGIISLTTARQRVCAGRGGMSLTHNVILRILNIRLAYSISDTTRHFCPVTGIISLTAARQKGYALAGVAGNPTSVVL